MNIATVLLLLTSLGSLMALRSSAPAEAVVAYPQGYRNWAHVKSAVISPSHSRFAAMGGFQHTYANTEGMVGYRTRTFPEGSIVVVDWLEMRDEAGAYSEGPRRQIDVMVKDSQRFPASGGWGFQRFMKDSTTELSTTLKPQECFACHDRLKKDGLILGALRP
jgi:hypothetical protein